MKHSLKFAVLLLAALFTFSSCKKEIGRGPVITEERLHTNFDELSVNILGKVTYRQGTDYRVVVRAQQNILDIIQTNVMAGQLIVKFQSGKQVGASEEIEVEITSPQLTWVMLAGSADLELASPIAGSFLELVVSGSGNIHAQELNLSEELVSHITGSGNINVDAGATPSARYKVTGSGNIKADALTAVNVNAEISGSGNIRLLASQTLQAKISGSGSIYYRGTPQINSQVSGSGSVRAL